MWRERGRCIARRVRRSAGVWKEKNRPGRPGYPKAKPYEAKLSETDSQVLARDVAGRQDAEDLGACGALAGPHEA